MSGFSEEEFGNFLERANAGEEYKEHIELTRLRLRDTLVKHGVEFPPAEGFPRMWYDDQETRDAYLDEQFEFHEIVQGHEATDEDYRIIMDGFAKIVSDERERREALTSNELRLMLLSFTVVDYEFLSRLSNGSAQITQHFALEKKRLQATYRLEGVPPVWHDIADEELPGPSLGDEDEELLDEVALETARHEIEAAEQQDETRRLIKRTVAEAGLVEPTFDDEYVIVLLTGAYDMFRMRNMPWQEHARRTLLNAGIELTPVWRHVIENLQTTEEP